MITSPFQKPALVPPAEHPRLMLTKKDFPRIRENLERKENAVVREIYEELCERQLVFQSPTPEYGNYNLADALSVEARAFRALLSGKKADARLVIEEINQLMDGFYIDGGNMGARWGGHLIFVASEIYDWCYDFMTSEERTKMIADCERIAAAYFEMGYPPEKQAAISGHGVEAQLLRDLLAFSIAVYDERPDIYDFCAGRILEEYVPAIHLLFEGGAHNQGPTYGSYRYVSLVWCELLFAAMSGKRIFDCFDKTIDWLIYMTRPDGEDLRLGDAFNESKSEWNRKQPFLVPFFFSYAMTGRKDVYELYQKGFCREYILPLHYGMDYYREGSWGEGLISPISVLMFDRFTPEKETKSLAKCQYFGTPVGETVFKDGDTMIFMKIGEYWGSNHDHLDMGCFQVYSGAPLLTDSGYYDSYHSAHRRQYATHTSAHNCLTVERDDQNQFGEWEEGIRYDGSMRRPNHGNEPRTIDLLLSDVYKMATIVSHQESEDGCELTGDLSEAYVHSCSKFVRSMNYDANKRLLTIHDEVDALQANYKKTFHLHMLTEPVIEGNTITITNQGHTAVCRVLSPANAVITKEGGPGKQFVVDGENFDPEPCPTSEMGWGQVKISPDTPSVHDTFIVEIQL